MSKRKYIKILRALASRPDSKIYKVTYFNWRIMPNKTVCKLSVFYKLVNAEYSLRFKGDFFYQLKKDGLLTEVRILGNMIGMQEVTVYRLSVGGWQEVYKYL